MNNIVGIYSITNKVNNKIYIGQSVNIYNRWKSHICELNNNHHYNSFLQNAWNKYGSDNFEFEIIETCNIEELDEKEIFYIELYNSLDRDYGYNLTNGGSQNHKVSDETKERMKIAAISVHAKRTVEEKNIISEKLSKSKTGRGVGADNSFYGKSHTEETKLILSEKAKERYKNKEDHPFTGRHHTDEAKLKMSNAKKGKKMSDEFREKMSKISSGKNNPRATVPVYCPELDEEFWGAKEVQDKYGVNKDKISDCIHGRRETTGKHPATGEKLHWIKIEK